MIQEAKEYQDEFFAKENYSIVTMDSAIEMMCKECPNITTEFTEDNIRDDTNCDFVVLNNGKVAIAPERIAKL